MSYDVVGYVEYNDLAMHTVADYCSRMELCEDIGTLVLKDNIRHSSRELMYTHAECALRLRYDIDTSLVNSEARIACITRSVRNIDNVLHTIQKMFNEGNAVLDEPIEEIIAKHEGLMHVVGSVAYVADDTYSKRRYENENDSNDKPDILEDITKFLIDVFRYDFADAPAGVLLLRSLIRQHAKVVVTSIVKYNAILANWCCGMSYGCPAATGNRTR